MRDRTGHTAGCQPPAAPIGRFILNGRSRENTHREDQKLSIDVDDALKNLIDKLARVKECDRSLVASWFEKDEESLILKP